MTRPVALSTRLAYATAWIRGQLDTRPQVAAILGSGLGAFADRLSGAATIPYGDIPGFPTSRVPGHAGQLVVGQLPAAGAGAGVATGATAAVTVVLMQGRAHAYEGWSADEVAFGARVLCALGVKALLVTNAAGGVNPDFQPGDLVRITDHLNLTGHNPLVGENDDKIGPRFPDMSQPYDARLGALLDEAAAKAGAPLRQGVYAGVLGPSYETPAEVRMLRALGADLVGMSTVHDVLVARHMGVPVAGLSVVTNPATGLSRARLTHEEVQQVAARAKVRLEGLLLDFLPRAAG